MMLDAWRTGGGGTSELYQVVVRTVVLLRDDAFLWGNYRSLQAHLMVMEAI